MIKQTSQKIKNKIENDIRTTMNELRQKKLVRDECGVSTKQTGKEEYEISFSQRSDANSVMLDKHMSPNAVIDTLLRERQYLVLLYDKSIIQAEFCIKNGEIIKERLVFIKKHNRILSKKEIEEADADDEDWFENEEGIPLFLRVDYDPSSHVECKHPISHLTLSNNKACRIPIQDVITFSEFIRFILHHFYDLELDIKTFRLEKDCSITDLERKMIHIGWN